MATEFRTIDRHGHDTLDLERSDHAEGTAWRGWRVVGAALPAEIAKIRCDCGNGLITKDEMKARELAWGRRRQAEKRKRKAA
jgi:hypothetical protein